MLAVVVREVGPAQRPNPQRIGEGQVEDSSYRNGLELPLPDHSQVYSFA